MGPIELEVLGQKCPTPAPEVFDDQVSFIKFVPDKKHSCFKMTLGGAHVMVWKPDALVDDSSLMSLETKQGFQGIKEKMTYIICLYIFMLPYRKEGSA